MINIETSTRRPISAVKTSSELILFPVKKETMNTITKTFEVF